MCTCVVFNRKQLLQSSLSSNISVRQFEQSADRCRECNSILSNRKPAKSRALPSLLTEDEREQAGLIRRRGHSTKTDTFYFTDCSFITNRNPKSYFFSAIAYDVNKTRFIADEHCACRSGGCHRMYYFYCR